jgi:pimeloyl-ACP methyl ester carboxylesterase
MGTAPYATGVTLGDPREREDPEPRAAGATSAPGPRAGEGAETASAPDVAEPEAMVVATDTGVRIAYLDWGGPPDGPPVVLVHGITRTAWAWGPVARRMSSWARVVAVDLRGHGASDAPRAGYEMASLALDALTVVSARGWGADVGGPPVLVAGHGMGGMVAATMATLRPDSVRALALIDGGWEDVAEATRLSPSELLAAIDEPPEVLASLEAFLEDRRAFDPATWDADQERAARSQVDPLHAGHVRLVTRAWVLRRLVDAMYEYQPLEALARVACPVLVVVAGFGAADDDADRERLLALDDAQRARAAAGRAPARVVRMAGGHDVARYRPDELASELLALAEASGSAQGESAQGESASGGAAPGQRS